MVSRPSGRGAQGRLEEVERLLQALDEKQVGEGEGPLGYGGRILGPGGGWGGTGGLFWRAAATSFVPRRRSENGFSPCVCHIFDKEKPHKLFT